MPTTKDYTEADKQKIITRIREHLEELEEDKEGEKGAIYAALNEGDSVEIVMAAVRDPMVVYCAYLMIQGSGLTREEVLEVFEEGARVAGPLFDDDEPRISI